ncbi:LD-carboxypeptidase [Ammoniphilus sp. CFH 90114]|uniref:S66 peptidase family protein n=1 Tax=Ammoniphilus sp. CFH 90114 TaxID=2493665 RepID=UPI00100EF020|nr:LD-carboxypeptidase [Ammoniphilus sp. CFH 90114]RXT15548.1 LD-carboxypeptidase [Ammoniphilus sp. CFH 90114]
MLKGRALVSGDTIGLTAPAGPAKREAVERGIAEIESLGFKVKVGDSVYQEYGGYLAGDPVSRAKELESMFTDSDVDAILCLRGGYGSPQLLSLLDYELISKHPKIFIGYSDITALHLAFHKKCGLATIHGPMAASELAKEADEFTKDRLVQAVTQGSPIGRIQNPDHERLIPLVEGVAEGVLIGGNLTLISALMGTPYELDTKGKILFIEEIGEEAYKVDRMLTQLALAGKFKDASGIVLGSFTECESENYAHGFNILQVAENILTPFGKPAVYNLQAGHCFTKVTLPFGVKARLNATDGELIIEESVVI